MSIYRSFHPQVWNANPQCAVTLLVFLLPPQSRVPNPIVNVDQLCLNVVSPCLPSTDIVCNATRWFIPAFSLHTAVLFSLQSLCLMHTGKPMGVAVSHCRTWFQPQLIPTTCQICYHSHLWDHRSTGQLCAQFHFFGVS